ncbi:MAG TPA: Arm DNA-binding domain-containing protein [Steroidobacteraceae bacterium]
MTGEGGTKASGKQMLGPKHRVYLGNYPAVSLSEARAKAVTALAQAKRGVHPREDAVPTAGGLTVEKLSQEFMEQHGYSRELHGAAKYEVTFKTHINPCIGR